MKFAAVTTVFLFACQAPVSIPAPPAVRFHAVPPGVGLHGSQKVSGKAGPSMLGVRCKIGHLHPAIDSLGRRQCDQR